MNRKKTFILGVSAVAVMLTVAGCHVPTITADYIVPPQAITDLKGIDTMEIAVDVSLSGNRVSRGDESIIKSAASKRLAAYLYRQGYYQTPDFIWGNSEGANKVRKRLEEYKSQHGYSRIVTDPVASRARVELRINAAVNSYERDLSVKTVLKTQHFQKLYRRQTISWGSGEHRQYETILVPYSVPLAPQYSNAFSTVRQYSVSAAGNMEIRVFDKKGNMVYRKNFNNLQYTAFSDHKNLAALPDNAQVLSMLFRDSITEIVKDLSPNKVLKTVKINKDGNKRGYYLLQALAFSEAVTTFERIKENERTFADWENLGVTYEFLGDHREAIRCYEKAIMVKKEQKGFFDYDKNIAEEGLSRATQALADQKRTGLTR